MTPTPAPVAADSHGPDSEAPSIPTHRFAKLNPFKPSDDEGGDDLGQEADLDHLAGGGRVIGSAADIDERKKLRVSHALRSFLAHRAKEIAESDIGGDEEETRHSVAVQSILARSQVHQPAYVVDRTHPLTEYFISSSHNTYLVSKQLYGKSDANAYKAHLQAGARCVEIDAWDNDQSPDEPKVTHGYTLTAHVPFRSVCKAIAEQVEAEIAEAKNRNEPLPNPVFISLENHAGPAGQERISAILKEELRDKLVTEPVSRGPDGQSDATLGDLGGKVLVMVEWYGHTDAGDVAAITDAKEEESSSSSDEEERAYNERKAKAQQSKIVPELAALGVYAQSMKPTSNAWVQGTSDPSSTPHNALVNVEERAVKKLISEGASHGLVSHNASNLMRIYPKGLRINSSNLNPVPFWGVGAQVCALNMQTFDYAAGLNEAMFANTDGWVLKPPHLRRQPGPKPSGKVQLRLEIAGATDLPVPDDREKDIKPYVTCSLYHPQATGSPAKRKTSHYRPHKHRQLFGKEQPPATSPIWDPPEQLEWQFDNDDLAFLRILIKSDDAFARNPAFLTTSIRLTSAPNGQWTFFRLLNLRGVPTAATLLARFTLRQV
ncbi:Phosphoinositide-specific phospholipase C [Ceraceosorus bombacis]|uniref:Phosphoinositide phospholipase C n=1 Tax=Ceraceosorus bombacis TaxID=401625 RepID=A0A0P1BP96_9BASI|nr:Phosphoinositide-specific phospholipase C [Ceraceosorus bombacis]